MNYVGCRSQIDETMFCKEVWRTDGQGTPEYSNQYICIIISQQKYVIVCICEYDGIKCILFNYSFIDTIMFVVKRVALSTCMQIIRLVQHSKYI